MTDVKFITTKQCVRCKEHLALDRFSPDKRAADGKQSICKNCCNKERREKKVANPELNRQLRRIFYKNNKAKFAEYNAKLRIRNADKIKARKRNEYLKIKDDPIFKQKRKEYNESRKDAKRLYDIEYRQKNALNLTANENTWAKRNPRKANAVKKKYHDKKIKESPAYALAVRIRAGVMCALKSRSYPKKKRTSEILGCTYPEFQQHIERQFNHGMSWEKMGEIHIDHIIPISTAVTEDDVIRLFHFTNLRPLWAKENMSKGAKQLFLC